MSTPLLGISLFLTMLSLFFYQHVRTSRMTKSLLLNQATLTQRVHDITLQLTHIGQTVLPISTAFQAILIKELTHFHTPRMDALLAKLGPPYSLTDAEEDELLAALIEREHDMGDLISDSERDAAHIFPSIMRRAKVEAQTFGPETQTRLLLALVSTPPSVSGV